MKIQYCVYLGQEEVTLTRPVLNSVMAQNNKGTVGIYMTHTGIHPLQELKTRMG